MYSGFENLFVAVHSSSEVAVDQVKQSYQTIASTAPVSPKGLHTGTRAVVGRRTHRGAAYSVNPSSLRTVSMSQERREYMAYLDRNAVDDFDDEYVEAHNNSVCHDLHKSFDTRNLEIQTQEAEELKANPVPEIMEVGTYSIEIPDIVAYDLPSMRAQASQMADQWCTMDTDSDNSMDLTFDDVQTITPPSTLEDIIPTTPIVTVGGLYYDMDLSEDSDSDSSDDEILFFESPELDIEPFTFDFTLNQPAPPTRAPPPTPRYTPDLTGYTASSMMPAVRELWSQVGSYKKGVGCEVNWDPSQLDYTVPITQSFYYAGHMDGSIRCCACRQRVVAKEGNFCMSCTLQMKPSCARKQPTPEPETDTDAGMVTLVCRTGGRRMRSRKTKTKTKPSNIPSIMQSIDQQTFNFQVEDVVPEFNFITEDLVSVDISTPVFDSLEEIEEAKVIVTVFDLVNEVDRLHTEEQVMLTVFDLVETTVSMARNSPVPEPRTPVVTTSYLDTIPTVLVDIIEGFLPTEPRTMRESVLRTLHRRRVTLDNTRAVMSLLFVDTSDATDTRPMHADGWVNYNNMPRVYDAGNGMFSDMLRLANDANTVREITFGVDHQDNHLRRSTDEDITEYISWSHLQAIYWKWVRRHMNLRTDTWEEIRLEPNLTHMLDDEPALPEFGWDIVYYPEEALDFTVDPVPVIEPFVAPHIIVLVPDVRPLLLPPNLDLEPITDSESEDDEIHITPLSMLSIRRGGLRLSPSDRQMNNMQVGETCRYRRRGAKHVHRGRHNKPGHSSRVVRMRPAPRGVRRYTRNRQRKFARHNKKVNDTTGLLKTIRERAVVKKAAPRQSPLSNMKAYAQSLYDRLGLEMPDTVGSYEDWLFNVSVLESLLCPNSVVVPEVEPVVEAEVDTQIVDRDLESFDMTTVIFSYLLPSDINTTIEPVVVPEVQETKIVLRVKKMTPRSIIKEQCRDIYNALGLQMPTTNDGTLYDWEANLCILQDVAAQRLEAQDQEMRGNDLEPTPEPVVVTETLPVDIVTLIEEFGAERDYEQLAEEVFVAYGRRYFVGTFEAYQHPNEMSMETYQVVRCMVDKKIEDNLVTTEIDGITYVQPIVPVEEVSPVRTLTQEDEEKEIMLDTGADDLEVAGWLDELLDQVQDIAIDLTESDYEESDFESDDEEEQGPSPAPDSPSPDMPSDPSDYQSDSSSDEEEQQYRHVMDEEEKFADTAIHFDPIDIAAADTMCLCSINGCMTQVVGDFQICDTHKGPEFDFEDMFHGKSKCVRVGCQERKYNGHSLCRAHWDHFRTVEMPANQLLKDRQTVLWGMVPDLCRMPAGADQEQFNFTVAGNAADLYQRYVVNQEPLPAQISVPTVIRSVLKWLARQFNMGIRVSAQETFQTLALFAGHTRQFNALQRFIIRAQNNVSNVFITARVRFDNQGVSRWGRFDGTVRLAPGATQEQAEQAFKDMLEAEQQEDLYPGNIVDVIMQNFTGVRLFDLRDIRMFGVTLINRLKASLAEGSIPVRNGTCVLDYVYNQMIQAGRWKSKTIGMVQAELEEACDHPVDEGISTRDLELWIQKYKYSISIRALEPLTNQVFYDSSRDQGALIEEAGEDFQTVAMDVVKPNKEISRLNLVFIVANKHCYPITHPALRKQVFQTNALEMLGASLMETSIVTDTDDFMYVDGEELAVMETLPNVKVIYTNMDLEAYVQSITERGTYIPDQIAIYNHEIIKLVDPESGIIMVRHDDFHECKRLCEYLIKLYDGEDFIFRGQGFTTIAKNLCNLVVGTLPEQKGTHAQWAEFEDLYTPLALVQAISSLPSDIRNQNWKNNKKDMNRVRCIDMNKCYTRALVGSTQDFLVFSEADDIKPFEQTMKLYKRAMYYIEAVERDEVDGAKIKLPAQAVTHEYLKVLIEAKIVKRENIKYVRFAKTYMSKDTFKEFVQLVEDVSADLERPWMVKKLVNRVIGMTNMKVSRKERGYITQSHDEVCALWTYGNDRNWDVNFRLVGDNFIMRLTEEKQLKSRNNYVYNQVICRANAVVLQKVMEIEALGGEVCAIKTDAIYWKHGPDAAEIVLDNDLWKVEKSEPPLTTWAPVRTDMVHEIKPWNSVSKEFVQQLRHGALVEGIAGSGKSHFMADLIQTLVKANPEVKIAVVAFTHAALGGLRTKLQKRKLGITYSGNVVMQKEFVHESKGRQMEDEEKVEEDLDTCASLELRTWEGMKWVKTVYDWVFVDEFSMLEADAYRRFTDMKLEDGTRFIISGDENQCPPIQGGGIRRPFYKMTKTELMRSLCEYNNLKLRFRTGRFSRYDQELFEFQAYFTKHRMIPEKYHSKTLVPGMRYNITHSNAKKTGIFTDTGTLNYTVGQEVVGDYDTRKHRDFAKMGFYKNKKYVIAAIENVENELVYYIDVDRYFVRIPVKCFKPSNAMTAYKYQGATIEVPHNIHEAKRMCFEEFYTASTRARRMSDIHFDGASIKDHKFHSVYDFVCQTRPMKPEPYYAFSVQIGGKVEVRFEDKDECKVEAVDQEIEVTRIGKFIASTKQYVDRHFSRLTGTPFEYVSGHANTVGISEFLDSKFKISKNKSGYAIRVKVDGDNINVRRKKEDDMSQIRTDLLQKYYPSLVYGSEDNPKRSIGDKSGHELKSKPNGEVRQCMNNDDPLPEKTEEEVHQPMKFGQLIRRNIRKVERDLAKEAELVGVVPQVDKKNDGPAQANLIDHLKWYRRQNPAVYHAVKTGLIVKWVEERTETAAQKRHREYTTDDKAKQDHFFTGDMTRRDLINSIVERQATYEDAFFYELLSRDTRLFCDLDLERSELEWDLTDEEILMSALTVIRNQVEEETGKFNPDAVRILTACTDKKISYHITVLDHVFEHVTHQKAFWFKVAERAKTECPQLWFATEHASRGTIQKSAIDLAVYTKNRPMRCIYSEKDGKKNPLYPLVRTEKGEWDFEVVLTKAQVGEYLVNAPVCLLYSQLTVYEKAERSTGVQRFGRVIRTNLTPEIKQELKDIKLPAGFTLFSAKMNGPTSIVLFRTGAGGCPCCHRVHHKQNARLSKFRGQWEFKCFQGNGSVAM